MLRCVTQTGPNRERDGSSHNAIGRDYDFCKEYIWTNLLYITNMYPNQFANSMKIDRSQPDWYAECPCQPVSNDAWKMTPFQLSVGTSTLVAWVAWVTRGISA